MVYFAAESLVYFGAEWWCSMVRNMHPSEECGLTVLYIYAEALAYFLIAVRF
ncbi:hypothetical protein [Sphingobacterium multivorum]|uniref:hypothetical protein n=1 Tax=Sphingobacterium multivorum TaxID=28454 RepID=UPI00289D6F3B|nr:hypothetical protein [Sphingobacterium multivorum]